MRTPEFERCWRKLWRRWRNSFEINEIRGSVEDLKMLRKWWNRHWSGDGLEDQARKDEIATERGVRKRSREAGISGDG